MNHSKVTHPEKGEEGDVSLFNTTSLVVMFIPASSIEAPIMTVLTG